MLNKLSKALGRPVGFSTGCFHNGMDLYTEEVILLIRKFGYGAIEIMLGDMTKYKELNRLSSLIKRFEVKSLHLPGNIRYDNTREIRLFLGWFNEFYQMVGANLAIVHPDAVDDWQVFHSFSNMQFAVENMDISKPCYHQPQELIQFFDDHPDWKLVLDLSHCYGHDRTLNVVGEFMHRFGGRIAELHLSGSGVGGNHLSLYKSGQESVVKAIPAGTCPIIIEGPLINPEKDMKRELRFIYSVSGF